MSHESIEPGRVVVYHLPTLFSDSLRTLQFKQFFSSYRGVPFAVRTADGWSWSSWSLNTSSSNSSSRAFNGSIPEFTAQFRTRADLDAVIGDAGEAALGRIFLDGGLEIQGNIFSLLAVAQYALLHSEGFSNGLVQTLFRISSDVTRKLHLARGAGASRNWQCAPCPLDLPVDFYQPWLGPDLLHSCGSFGNHQKDLQADLEVAQGAALARVSEWLDLSPGDDLLDIGCGWGSLAMHAAQHCRAAVRGIASSQAQADSATERICRSDLQSHCTVESRDLRRAPYPPASFHKIAALGIFEQVPSRNFGQYLACLNKMLTPGGLLLLHRMTPTRTSGTHLRTLHPGLPTEPLTKDLALAEMGGWELVNVETLQRDYAETLRIWIGRLRQSAGEISSPFAYGYRAWLLYLVEIATSLQADEVKMHRILLRRPSRLRAMVC